MNLYRIYSIKDVFMKQFSPDLRKVAAPFFHLQSLFSNLHIENLYMSTYHINSILIDEDGLSKIQLFSKMKFGKHTSLAEISKEACVYNEDEFTKFKIKNPHDVTAIIKNHMRQEHIQKIIRLKKESLREAAVKKEILRSRIYNDYDKSFHNKKTVSIDFEYINLDIFELGISVYEDGKQSSYHYLIKENYVKKKTKPELQFMFNFGNTKIIPESDIASIIKKHLVDSDYLLLHGHSNDYLILRKYGLDMEKEEKGEEVFCYGLKDHFAVLSDGSVVPCCLDRESEITLGNIFSDDLSKILSGERAERMRQGFQCRKATEELCRKCGYARRF